MLSPQEFIVRWPADDVVRLLPDWGTDELIRYDPAILETISLPEESRRFLAQAGLPGQALYSLRFDLPPNNLPPLPEAEALAGKYSFPPDYRRYRLMGASFHKISQAVGYRLVNFTFYCLDEQEG